MRDVIFSVDLEDWYQGIEIPHYRWSSFQDRIYTGATILLNLLESYKIKATFFVLGCVAEKHPNLIEEIASKGHEIGTHGYYHEKIYELTPKQFEIQLQKSLKILQSITSKKVIGHRAPYFSITHKSLWALRILAENGIQYDSSIYPAENWRYGISNTPDTPYIVAPYNIIEFPVSTIKLLNRHVGLGGAYFRILPYYLSKKFIQSRLQLNKVTSFYIHPWELDPRHPRINFRKKAMLTHYFGLGMTQRRLMKLLNDFSFISFEEHMLDVKLEKLSKITFQ